jgi:hypothetical protein
VDRFRRSPGQASLEYVGLLALLVILLTAGLAFTGALPALGQTVIGSMRHGICLVSGSVCTPREAAAAGLSPCPLFRRSENEQASASVSVIALARGDAMAIERRSDGTASVSFMDGGQVGVTAGVGLQFSPLHVRAAADGTAGVQFTAGRTWEFRSFAAADAFVNRFASGQSLGGEARALGHKLCFLCPGWLRGPGRPKLPPPASRSVEGGVIGQATVALGIKGKSGYPISFDPMLGTVLGRQQTGARTTWYLELDGQLLAHLGPLLAPLAGAHSASAVMELTSDGGRPVEMAIRAATAASNDPALSGATLTGTDLAERIRRAATGGPGGALEAEVSLDLRDPANLAAVRGFISAGIPRPSDIVALARRLDVDGAVDLRLFDYRASDFDVNADVALGARLGAGYERTVESRRLLGAWSRLPGDRLREREDCTATTST